MEGQTIVAYTLVPGVTAQTSLVWSTSLITAIRDRSMVLASREKR
jgi:hypothetical protein